MLSVQRILCPTDLSYESDEALGYAVTLAQRTTQRSFCCTAKKHETMAMAAKETLRRLDCLPLRLLRIST